VSFLNGALVLGALTALVPLVIHLFNRSRFKVIKWGASHLLESVLRKNRKQIQLEQWIILIIRCAIPILLALTLARMVVMNWNSFLFFLLLPLGCPALPNHHGIYKKNPDILGSTLWCLLTCDRAWCPWFSS
jgi:hypothetical protein